MKGDKSLKINSDRKELIPLVQKKNNSLSSTDERKKYPLGYDHRPYSIGMFEFKLTGPASCPSVPVTTSEVKVNGPGRNSN